MTKDELQDYLIEEAEIDEEIVLSMSNTELVDRYLRYNGIIGYTFDILDVVTAAFGVKLED